MITLRVGNAPCSWGVMGGDDQSLYPPYTEVLDEIAASGYTGTELGYWGFLPTDPPKLRVELTSRGLSMIGALVPAPLADRTAHESGKRDALRAARLLAAVADPAAPLPFIISRTPTAPTKRGPARPEGSGQSNAETAQVLAHAAHESYLSGRPVTVSEIG